MKIFPLCFSLLFASFFAFGQPGKPEPTQALATFPFVSKLKNDAKGEAKASELKSFVCEKFAQKPRFNFIDREVSSDIMAEIKNQAQEVFINSPVVAEQLKQWGASHLLTGILNNATGSISKTSMMGVPMTSLKGDVTFDLVITEVSTGKTMARKSFKASGSEDAGVSYGNFSSSNNSNPNDVAVAVCKNSIQKQVDEWLKDLFVPPLKFLKVSEADEKTGVAKKLLMKGGEEGTFSKGDKIIANSIEMLEGVRITRKIGMLEVGENLGQAIEIKIKDGAPIIDKAIKNNEPIEFLKFVPASK